MTQYPLVLDGFQAAVCYSVLGLDVLSGWASRWHSLLTSKHFRLVYLEHCMFFLIAFLHSQNTLLLRS